MTKNFLTILIILIYSSSYSQNFDLQGHRGARGLLPENSIPAFIKALDLGVTTIELDLAITGDGSIIVSHEPWFNSKICLDPDGNRITKGWDHNIYQMSYDQVKKYDCGSIGNPNYPEQRKITSYKPLLSEVIEEVEAHIKSKSKYKVRYNIEIKSNPKTDNTYHPSPAHFSKLVYQLVEDYLELGRVTIQSFDPRILRYWHENYENVELAFLVENSLSIEENLNELGFDPNIYSPEYNSIKESDIDMLHERGIKLIPWTVNEKVDMERLREWGVDGLITDYPDRATSLGMGIKIPFEGQ